MGFKSPGESGLLGLIGFWFRGFGTGLGIMGLGFKRPGASGLGLRVNYRLGFKGPGVQGLKFKGPGKSGLLELRGL